MRNSDAATQTCTAIHTLRGTVLQPQTVKHSNVRPTQMQPHTWTQARILAEPWTDTHTQMKKHSDATTQTAMDRLKDTVMQPHKAMDRHSDAATQTCTD